MQEHEIEAARLEAEAALPQGWELQNPDPERFSLPGRKVDTCAAIATGPGGDATIAMGMGVAGAYIQLARRLRGDLPETIAWAPPVPPPDVPPDKVEEGLFFPDRESEEAVAEARAALPPEWVLYDLDRERFRLPSGKLEVYGASAAGPAGEAVLVVGVGQAEAIRQLARRLRGELTESDGWAPLLPRP